MSDHNKSANGRLIGTIVGAAFGGVLTIVFVYFFLHRYCRTRLMPSLRVGNSFQKRQQITGVMTTWTEQNTSAKSGIGRVRPLIQPTVSDGEKKLVKNLYKGETATL